jgi:hypothetical protein
MSTNLLFLPPLLVTLPLKVSALVGIKEAPNGLAVVAGIGALVAMVGNPFFGRMSDRTSSRLGMRRPWMVIGLVGGSLGILIVALAPNIPLVLVGWCGGNRSQARAGPDCTATWIVLANHWKAEKHRSGPLVSRTRSRTVPRATTLPTNPDVMGRHGRRLAKARSAGTDEAKMRKAVAIQRARQDPGSNPGPPTKFYYLNWP